MRKKIFRSIVLMSIGVLVTSLLLITISMYNYIDENEKASSRAELDLIAEIAEENKDDFHFDVQGYRVTVISQDGIVLYDSIAEKDMMENHSGREEVEEALSEEYGESSRYSATLMEETLYFAKKLSDGNVLRISIARDSVFKILVSMFPTTIIVFIIVLLVSFFMAKKIARNIVEPINALNLEDPMNNHIYEEITPLLKRIETQNKQIITQQTMSEKTRKEFSANVSHELKTPLQTIMGSAELIENGIVKADDVPKFASAIRAESHRLLTLINDIIRLSQLDEGEKLPVEPVDVYEIVKDVCSELAEVAEKKNISINVEGVKSMVSAIPRLIYEIVYNLCDNAIKYNNPDGYVNVTVKKDSKKVTITVVDNGIGIPEEHRERIFERFYRVDKSHSKESGGTGLGLSIVKHAASYLDAEVKLESKVGYGTAVTVNIPR